MTTSIRRPLDGMLVLDLGQIYNGPERAGVSTGGEARQARPRGASGLRDSL
jgi:hypothetical protein